MTSPALRIVRGEPTAEELAAIFVAVSGQPMHAANAYERWRATRLRAARHTTDQVRRVPQNAQRKQAFGKAAEPIVGRRSLAVTRCRAVPSQAAASAD